MADPGNAENRMGRVAVDYKTLFLGACLLVSILGGGLWGLWNSYNAGQLEDARHTNDLQWERIRALNDAVIESRSTLSSIQSVHQDQEERLRALERWTKR